VTTRTPMPGQADLVDEIVGACIAYDAARVQDQLDRAVQALDLGNCIDEVLFPVLRRIGALWQSGQIDLEAERLTSEAVRGWLELCSLRAPEPQHATPLLLACGPADRHSIGLEALAVLLRHQRRRCRVLGPRTSVRALTTAVLANGPGAVVIASHMRANRSSATAALRAAVALGPEGFYAGEAFASVRLRRHVPGTHLDGSLSAACTTILASPRQQRPA
jgi:methanogenic corrinoid protein MtbC1